MVIQKVGMWSHILAPANHVDDKNDQTSDNDEQDDAGHHIYSYQSARCC